MFSAPKSQSCGNKGTVLHGWWEYPYLCPFCIAAGLFTRRKSLLVCKVHPPAEVLSVISEHRQTHNNSLHNAVLFPKGMCGAERKTVWEVKAFVKLWPKLMYRRWLHLNPSFGEQSLGLELLVVAVAFLWSRKQYLQQICTTLMPQNKEEEFII